MYEVRVPGFVLRDSVGGRAPGRVCNVCSCTCALVVRDSVGHALLSPNVVAVRAVGKLGLYGRGGMGGRCVRELCSLGLAELCRFLFGRINMV